jgi:hypothetical protein
MQADAKAEGRRVNSPYHTVTVSKKKLFLDTGRFCNSGFTAERREQSAILTGNEFRLPGLQLGAQKHI